MTTHSQNPGNPTANLTRIDEMRRAMRRQALENFAEADRLDALYTAVIGYSCASDASGEVQS